MTTLNPSIADPATPSVRLLSLGAAIPFFVIPALVFILSDYWGVPALVGLGLPPSTAYMVALLNLLIGKFLASLLAFQMEGNPLTREALADRFRLGRMTRTDWLWTLGGWAAGGIGMGLLTGVGRLLVAKGFIPLPASILVVLDPATPSDLATFRDLMGASAVGNWWLVILGVALLFFNIIGEEFWWRGYILPHQELAHGRWAWAIHGTLWALFHAFKYWDWLGLLPICLVISYIARRRRNTWPGIIIHSLVNSALLFPITAVVLGLVG